MRIAFVSRRFFPAISGMSVYALNLLRELVLAGHEVTMVSQFRGDAEGTKVYGGGPPPPVPGVRVIGLEARGEQDGGDFERDIEEMASTVVAEGPFDVIHAQYGYPTGLAALEASRRTGTPNLVSVQGGDGHWVGECCSTHRDAMLAVLEHAGAVLIGSASFRDEVVQRLGVAPERFDIVPGASTCTASGRPRGRRTPRSSRSSTTAGSTAGRACSTSCARSPRSRAGASWSPASAPTPWPPPSWWASSA